MKRKTGFWTAFLVVFFLCILILSFSLSGKLKFLPFLEKPAMMVQSFSYNLFQELPFVSESPKLKKLEDENLKLLSRVSDFEKLKRENAALSDQFQTSYPQDENLLKTNIVSAPSFIPGVSAPTRFIINKGLKDNLEKGLAVVIKNNLVGVITQVSQNTSSVNTINNPSFSFTARTESGAVGLIKNESGLTLDNVLLSDNLKIGEIVLTKGDVENRGIGIPPDLIIGKIVSVEKNPSNLFQKAEIKSFVNLENLSTVFVYIKAK